jgi:hypothetical protein
MKKNQYVLIVLMIFFMVWGCTEKYPGPTEDSTLSLTGGSCVTCHTDQELLKEVADPLPPPDDDSGEG